MPKTLARNLKETNQDIVVMYRNDRQPWPATAIEIARWATRHRHWLPPKTTAIKLCAQEIARAMREEHYRDPQGRLVRVNHAARTERGDEQLTLWADIRTATREHMQIAFQQRRNQIVGNCQQLNTDINSYNDNGNDKEPIQMVFDFTYDVEESETQLLPNKPR